MTKLTITRLRIRGLMAMMPGMIMIPFGALALADHHPGVGDGSWRARMAYDFHMSAHGCERHPYCAVREALYKAWARPEHIRTTTGGLWPSTSSTSTTIL
jgi:hypothetical protein